MVRVDLTVKGDTGQAYLFDAAQDDLTGHFNGNVIPDFAVGDPLFQDVQHRAAVDFNPFVGFTAVEILVISNLSDSLETDLVM